MTDPTNSPLSIAPTARVVDFAERRARLAAGTPVDKTVDQEAIAILTDALDAVRRGELRQVLIVAHVPAEDGVDLFIPGGSGWDGLRIVGALHALASTVQQQSGRHVD